MASHLTLLPAHPGERWLPPPTRGHHCSSTGLNVVSNHPQPPHRLPPIRAWPPAFQLILKAPQFSKRRTEHISPVCSFPIKSPPSYICDLGAWEASPP